MSKLKEKGITLVALVVTIIILLILAGVTLSLALSDTGLFKITQNVVDRYKLAQEEEEKSIADLEKDLAEYKSETQIPEEPPKGPNGKPLITEVAKTTEHGKIEGEDKLGNPVTIPGQFKVVEGETVEDGIVIEDSEGNQFVWIPVSNIDGDNNISTQEEGSIQIIKNDKSKVEITLGRYTFSSDGTPTPVQKGSQCSSTGFVIDPYYSENTTYGGAIGRAKDLAGFVNSVKLNHGYYIGRYEASFASGSAPVGSYGAEVNGNSSIMTNQKPAVKATKQGNDETVHSNSSTTSIAVGDLWRNITQIDSSIVCRNMYDTENRDVESDLVNSYAWDTAIVYIQAMEHNNYANKNRGTNLALKNTGDTGDEACNIYDIAGNLYEWITEYSSCVNHTSEKFLCVYRGGTFDTSACSATRGNGPARSSFGSVGFRPLIYIK